MTQDEIIDMARQAGFEGITSHEWVGYTNSLEAFAKLIAEKEREKLKNVAIFDRWYQELDAAVLAEREACESIEYDLAKSPAMFATMAEYKAYKDGVQDYRTKIIARGEA